jgi:hypothetical protein
VWEGRLMHPCAVAALTCVHMQLGAVQWSVLRVGMDLLSSPAGVCMLRDGCRNALCPGSSLWPWPARRRMAKRATEQSCLTPCPTHVCSGPSLCGTVPIHH